MIWNYLLFSMLFFLGLATRFLPHPANFTAIGAIAIFAGLYLPKKWIMVLPLLAMLISDFFIGFYTWQVMLSVYLSFALMVMIGLIVRRKKKPVVILGGAIAGSLAFYLITNLAVWVFSGLYPLTLTGLAQCYFLALPFFKNSLLADIFYTTILVGSYELCQKYLVKEWVKVYLK